jgi:hypothetical protein
MNLLDVLWNFLDADGSIARLILTQDNTNTGVTWTYTSRLTLTILVFGGPKQLTALEHTASVIGILL